MKKLPKIITDPPCDGCAKRKLWLMNVAAKAKASARALLKTRKPGSNAARRVVKNGGVR